MNPVASRQIIVGVADYKVSKDRESVLVTYALGSCLGITLYDPAARVGGLLHAMLPDSREHPRVQPRHAMYLDTGLEDLLDGLRSVGANLEALQCKVFGGAQVIGAQDYFRIGTKNLAAFATLARRYGLKAAVAEVGGHVNRTIRLSLQTGEVRLRLPGQPEISC